MTFIPSLMNIRLLVQKFLEGTEKSRHMGIMIPIILVGNPQGKRQCGRIIFKLISHKWSVKVQTGSLGSEEGSMAGLCEQVLGFQVS
jgi:hypothetical protein